VLDSAREAQIALTLIEAEGMPREAITVFTSEPIQFQRSGARRDYEGLIGIFAVAGGLLGSAAALALTIWTSRQVNLVTGGMPIVSPWALAVIVFEMTALGAILTCLGRMIFEARLARPNQPNVVSKEIAEGRVVMSLEIKESVARKAVESVFGGEAMRRIDGQEANTPIRPRFT
jgi:hypothetical protein